MLPADFADGMADIDLKNRMTRGLEHLDQIGANDALAARNKY